MAQPALHVVGVHLLGPVEDIRGLLFTLAAVVLALSCSSLELRYRLPGWCTESYRVRLGVFFRCISYAISFLVFYLNKPQ